MRYADRLDVLSYFAGLLKCRSILDEAVDPRLFKPPLSFALGALRFKLAFPSFLLKFGLSFNPPLISTDSTLTVLQFSGQDKLDHNVRNSGFEFTGFVILASDSLFFRADTLKNRKGHIPGISF
jgi:hypothetical protein